MSTQYLKFLFTGFLLFSLSPFKAQEAEQKPLVVATASIFADMARDIAGDEVEIQSIVPIGGDPHIYEPTPSDARLAAKANLVLRNGLTFEGWLSELIENSGTKANIVTITEGVEAIGSQTYANSSDPHAWMDAQRGLIYIENIKNALVELLPDLREQFEFNYGVYRKQLEDLDKYIEEEIQKIPADQRILITSHDAFQYYGRRYGLRLESVLGTSTDAEVQTSDIQGLIKVINESQVPAVFIESTINPKLLKQVASDNGVSIGGQLFADSLGDKDGPAGDYINMLKHNTDVIVKALSKVKQEAISTEGNAPETSNWLLYGILAVLLLGGLFLVGRRV